MALAQLVSWSGVMKLGQTRRASKTHQYIRDESRRRRLPALSAGRITRSSIEADVLGKRGVTSCVHVTHTEIASAPRTTMQGRVRQRFFRGPQHFPHRLRKIMHPTRDYPSPTALGYMYSTSAWMWARAYFQDGFMRQRISISAAMFSRLLVPMHIVTTRGYPYPRMVLNVSSHSATMCNMAQCSEGVWRLDLRCDAIHTHFVTDIRSYAVLRCEPRHSPGVGVVWLECAAEEPALRFALTNGVRVTKELVHGLHVLLDTEHRHDDVSRTPLGAMLQRLCEHIFGGAGDLIEGILKACLGPSQDKEYLDPDMVPLLDDILLHAPDDVQEIKDLRSELQGRHLRRLCEDQAKLRQARVAKRKERLAKAKAKARAKAKATAAPKPKVDPLAAVRRRTWRGARERPLGPPPLPPPLMAPDGVSEPSVGDGVLVATQPPASLSDAPMASPSVDPSAALLPPPDESMLVPASQESNVGGKRSLVYRTSSAIQLLMPPDNCTLSMDQNSLRWRAVVYGERLSSIGFGPRSLLNRRQSLDAMLGEVWLRYGAPRPAHPTIDEIDPALWDGQLDEREEKPKSYNQGECWRAAWLVLGHSLTSSEGLAHLPWWWHVRHVGVGSVSVSISHGLVVSS